MNPCTSKSLTPVSLTPVLKKKRVSHTVSFKIDVCDYFTTYANASVAGCSRFFHITQKQVRYFRKNEAFYRAIKNRRLRRNCIRPEQVRLRAKYSDQEKAVFTWFLTRRHEGMRIINDFLIILKHHQFKNIFIH